MPLKPSWPPDLWPYLTLLYPAWTHPSWHALPSHCPSQTLPIVLAQAQRAQFAVFVWEFCGEVDSFDLLIGVCLGVCVHEVSKRGQKEASSLHVAIIHRQGFALRLWWKKGWSACSAIHATLWPQKVFFSLLSIFFYTIRFTGVPIADVFAGSF